MIIVNFKIYKQTFGLGAVKLAKICKKVGEKSGVRILVAAGAWDIRKIKEEVEIEVLAQNVDEYGDGAWTGAMSMEALRAAGADGALINHSEKRKKPGTVRKILAHKPEGFLTVVCVQSWGQTERWAKKLKADIVAYEPKYLIGSKDKSVASEKPEMIKKMAEKYSPLPLLAGAGIHGREDVETALKMGAGGILVASDVVKSSNPEEELLELSRGF